MGYSTVKVVSRQHGEIHFDQIPTAAKNVKTIEATGTFGSITVNEIEATNQRIWHSHFKIKEDTHLNLVLQDETPSLRFLFSLKTNMKFYFNEFGQGIRLWSQYDILFNPNSDIEYRFKKGKEYAAFVIFLRSGWLQQWESTLPELSSIIERIERNEPIRIEKHVSPRMEIIIDELMSDADKRKIFVEAKVLELFNLVVKQIGTSQGKTRVIKLSQVEVNKIQKAREYLQNNIIQPGTIPELAKRVRLNDFKLKGGFKQVVGCTIHDFLMQERMAQALKILKEEPKLSVKEIAAKTGFKDDEYFAKVFEKWFGFSARSARKRA